MTHTKHSAPKLKGISGKLKEIIYLSWAELLHLYRLDIANPADANVRDVFTGPASAARLGSHVRGLERLGYKVTIEALAPEVDPETGELITRTAS